MVGLNLAYSFVSTSPALDPSGLAALQIPRSTRRDFAQPQPFDPSTGSGESSSGRRLNLNLLYQLPQNILNTPCNSPIGIIGLHTRKIAEVANMVAGAGGIAIAVRHGLPGMLLQPCKGFEDADGIGFAAANIVHRCGAGRCYKCMDKSGYIVAMNIIAHLLALVAKNSIGLLQGMAFNQVV